MAVAACRPVPEPCDGLEDEESKRFFKEQWPLYQQVLNNDYLEHALLYKAVQATLEEQAQHGPLDALDLGCGDADYLCRVLLRTSCHPLFRSYTGADLCVPAISIARTNLTRAAPTTTASFHVADLLSYVCDLDAPVYNVIMASFSVHHLHRDGKVEVLKAAHGLLAKRKGVMILVDIASREGESVQGFRARAAQDVDQNWLALKPESLPVLKKHMGECDWPECASWYEEVGRTVAGFSAVECVATGKNDLANVILFRV